MDKINDESVPAPAAPAVRRTRPTFGILLIVVGLLLLVHQVFPAFTSRLFWPLLLMAAGAWLLWGARRS
jgi:hypothetical protein